MSKHIVIDWTVDFETKRLKGSVEHTIEVLKEGTATVDFDSSKLVVEKVTVDGADTTFTVAEPHACLGQKISVAIPENKRSIGTKLQVFFLYACDPEASAIQWLDKDATKGGTHPYVFTQCQAIHARSLLPCQDAPGTKTTYSATVLAPTWCTVLMSALSVESDTASGVFKFNQPVPTSAYLIALAGGNLASRDISDRVRIWAEPEQVEAAAFEFDETEAFLKIAEDLTCPYAWGRYDVLCLPPSFPYGGNTYPNLNP